MHSNILFSNINLLESGYKVFALKKLENISVIGMGLLGGSLCLSISRRLPNSRISGYSHRQSTREKARNLNVAHTITDSLKTCVQDADLLVLATPISIFEETFRDIRDHLPKGCIVTDVGSTKSLVHRWAHQILPQAVHYIGSHPIAGSEQRGVEFARDDLFDKAACIVTTTKTSNASAAKTLKHFWSQIGCIVKSMSPAQHDRIFAHVSHVPHLAAAALVNAFDSDQLKFSGKGFMDTSRIASGPANIWADIFATNSTNCVKGIEKLIRELKKLQHAVASQDKQKIHTILEKARQKRKQLIEYKVKQKELIS